MSLKASLVRNLAAGSWTRVSAVLLRLIQVPLLLGALGAEEYGRWLLLSSVPVWLSLSNLGFGTAASNQMALASAADRHDDARTIYSTGFCVISGLGLIAFAGMAVAVLYVPWAAFLHAPEARVDEFRLAALLLVSTVLVSFYNELFGGRFQAARKAHVGILLYSVRTWLELGALALSVLFSRRFDVLAASLFVACTSYTVAIGFISRRTAPWMGFSLAAASRRYLRDLIGKGIGFQSFALGNALIFQGFLYVVSVVSGPVAVALFATARTLVRSVNQLMDLISQVISPELNFLLGSGNVRAAARLHRLSVGVALVSSLVAITVLGAIGVPLFSLWTGRTLGISTSMLLLFLVPVLLQSLWFTSSAVLTASNNHQGLATVFLLGSGVALAGCYVCAFAFGLKGAAASTALLDVILIPYVLHKSLALTKDTLPAFLRGIPVELRGAASTALARIAQWTRREGLKGP